MTLTDYENYKIIIQKIKIQDKNNDIALYMTISMLQAFMSEYLEQFIEYTEVVNEKNSNKSYKVPILKISPEKQLISDDEMVYFIKILIGQPKKYTCLVEKTTAEFLSILARYELFRNKLIEKGIVTITINILVTSISSEVVASCFKLIKNICFQSVEAQKQLINSSNISKVLDKFIEISDYPRNGRLFDTEESINMDALPKTIQHNVEDNFDLRNILVENNAVEILANIIIKHLNDNTLLVIECCELLHWLVTINSGKERATKCLLFICACMDFSLLFDDQKLLEKLSLKDSSYSTFQSLSCEEKLQSLRTSLVDTYISVFELIEHLIQDVNISKVVYNEGGFDFCFNLINKYLTYPFDEQLLSKLCDICVLLTLNDNVGDIIYKNSQKLKDIQTLLSCDNFCINSSAALILGNLCRCAERSEYFVENCCHNIVLNNMIKIIDHINEIPKHADYLFADIGCLKNFLVPVKCRQYAITTTNVNDVICCFEGIFRLDNRLLSVKSYTVLRMIISCNAANVCHHVLNSKLIMDSITKDTGIDSALGINIESMRILLTLATHCDSELINPNIFNKNIFCSIIKNNTPPNNQLYIDFSNLFNVIVSKNHQDVLPVIVDSKILSELKSTLISNTSSIAFPFLISALTTFVLALKTNFKAQFYKQIQGDDLLSVLSLCDRLNNHIVNQLTNQLKHSIDECSSL